jgi:hypothetical protein
MPKRKRGVAVEDVEDADGNDLYDMEDQEAAEDEDLSRTAADDLEISQVIEEVSLTYTVSAAEAKLGIDAVSKVCDQVSLVRTRLVSTQRPGLKTSQTHLPLASPYGGSREVLCPRQDCPKAYQAVGRDTMELGSHHAELRPLLA